MTGQTDEMQPSGSTPEGPMPAPLVEVDRVVVPLDGSPFAERALPVARWASLVVPPA